MSKYIKKFTNHAAYEAAVKDLDLPKVSLCVQEKEIHYDAYVAPFFCKITLTDDSVVEIQGSGTISSLSSYKDTAKKIELGKLCTSIGDQAFINFTALEELDMANTVTNMGMDICSGCTNLERVYLSNKLSILNRAAFNGCSSLTSITNPASITGSWEYSLGNCTSLEEIIFLGDTAPNMHMSTFYNIKPGGTIKVPTGSTGYDRLMSNDNYFLGMYNWTKVEQ